MYFMLQIQAYSGRYCFLKEGKVHSQTTFQRQNYVFLKGENIPVKNMSDVKSMCVQLTSKVCDCFHFQITG